MSMSMTKKLAVGAAIAAATAIALVAPASAHGHRHHFGFRAPIVLAPSYVATCDYFYWKWQRTGSRYWRAQYFACTH